MMKVEKSLLGLAGKYAVASELCRRGVHARLTVENGKRVILLADGKEAIARVEVRAKQGAIWPGVKGIAPEDELKFLVLVDFEEKRLDEQPDFYIISRMEWRPFLEEKLKEKLKHGITVVDEHNVARHSDGYVGAGIKAAEVARFKNDWDKILRVIGLTE